MEQCNEYLLVPSRLSGSTAMTMSARHSVTDQLSPERLMETVRNHQYRPYDANRGRKSAPRSRIMFTREQVAQLESFFAIDPYPKIRDRRRIADLMRITERRIQVWFQNRRAKSSRALARQDTGERLGAGQSFSPTDIPVSPLGMPISPPVIPSSVIRHYPSMAPRGADSDGEASIGSVHSFDSGRSSPPGGFAFRQGVGFVGSVNISTPYSNGIMYSAPVRHKTRSSVGSISSPETEHAEVPTSPLFNGSGTLSHILRKLDATESEALRQLGSFVDCQTRLLADLRRTCESAFVEL